MKKNRIMLFVCFVIISLCLFVPSLVTAAAPVGVIPTTSVEYVLPYPGILPTHPLYMCKILRDKIIELLITDPVHKSEFYILQADKKLNTGITFKSLGKQKEAKEAFNESFLSRSQAISMLETYIKAGNTVPLFVLEKLSLSLDKHEEVLKNNGENIESIAVLSTKVHQMTTKEE